MFNVELDLDTGPQAGRSYRLGYNITGKLAALNNLLEIDVLLSRRGPLVCRPAVSSEKRAESHAFGPSTN